MGVHKTSDHFQIKIKMPNLIQERPVSSKAPNQDLKDINVLCTCKTKIERPNLEHCYIKDQWLYPNLDHDAQLKSGTSSILQSPKWGLTEHGCSLQLQTQNRVPKIWRRKVSKASNNIQINIQILNPIQEPPTFSKAPNQTSRKWILFAPSNSR